MAGTLFSILALNSIEKNMKPAPTRTRIMDRICGIFIKGLFHSIRNVGGILSRRQKLQLFSDCRAYPCIHGSPFISPKGKATPKAGRGRPVPTGRTTLPAADAGMNSCPQWGGNPHYC
jgi:hypothetical protein